MNANKKCNPKENSFRWPLSKRHLHFICEKSESVPWRPRVNNKHDSVSSNNLDKHNTQWQWSKILKKCDFVLKDANVKILKKKADNVIMSHKCNYASSNRGHLRNHLKTHSGEKSNKCNQCDYACSYSHHLRTHLKMHSEGKSNKCNQCDFA